MKKNVYFFMVTAIFFVASNLAAASERGITTAAQYALKRLEYYTGEIDGLKGPRTRAALDAFANDKRLDHDEVIWSLTVHADAWKEKEIPGFIKEEILEYFEDELKDAESAKIAWETISYGKTSKNTFSVCGRINAKNSYGAFVGYQPFLASGVQLIVQEVYTGAVIASVNFGEIAEILCQFGVVYEQIDK